MVPTPSIWARRIPPMQPSRSDASAFSQRQASADAAPRFCARYTGRRSFAPRPRGRPRWRTRRSGFGRTAIPASRRFAVRTACRSCLRTARGAARRRYTPAGEGRRSERWFGRWRSSRRKESGPRTASPRWDRRFEHAATRWSGKWRTRYGPRAGPKARLRWSPGPVGRDSICTRRTGSSFGMPGFRATRSTPRHGARVAAPICSFPIAVTARQPGG